MRRGTEIGLFVGLTVLDQLVKQLTVHRTALLIPGVIRLQYTENRGFALGLFDGAGTAALVISLVVFIGVIVCLYRMPRDSSLRIPLIVICAGALGNLIDRVIFRYVIDFIYISLIDFPIFNVADMYVTIPAAFLVLFVLTVYKDDEFTFLRRKKEPQEKGEQ